MKRLYSFFAVVFLSGICFVQAQPLWRTVGGGMDQFIMDMVADSASGRLYMCGWFKYADTLEVNQTVAWDGQHWIPLGQGAGHSDSCYYQNCSDFHFIAYNQGDLFVNGSAPTGYLIGNQMVYSQLTRWDGAKWDSCGLPSGTAIPFSCSKQLFTLGIFNYISGQPANNLAIWNGAVWEPFGETIDFEGGYTYCAEYFQNKYHFAGNFGHQPGLKEIISWDGSHFQPLDNGILGDAWVDEMRVYKDLLYVGGGFLAADGNPSDYVMAWDGMQWWPAFNGVQFVSQVNNLEVIDGVLYMTGWHYVYDNGIWRGPFGVAKFDGTQFCSFGGPAFPIWDIAGLGGRFYVATNPSQSPDSIQYFGEYIGGPQDEVCIPMNLANAVAAPQLGHVGLYPNPATDHVKVQFEATETGTATISLMDLQGRLLRTWSHEVMALGSNVVVADLKGLAAGVYVVEVAAANFADHSRLIVR